MQSRLRQNNRQMCRYGDVEILTREDVEMWSFGCVDVEVCRSADVDMWMWRCEDVKMWR